MTCLSIEEPAATPALDDRSTQGFTDRRFGAHLPRPAGSLESMIVARQAINFGDASDYGSLAAEYFSLGAGTDIAPLLKGLDDDACHAPHWGFMMSGEVVITYTNGPEETCVGDDLFYWPPGHSVRVVRDAEVILFSPQVEHAEVINHMIGAMAG